MLHMMVGQQRRGMQQPIASSASSADNESKLRLLLLFKHFQLAHVSEEIGYLGIRAFVGISLLQDEVHA
jgi:hypothetical protein